MPVGEHSELQFPSAAPPRAAFVRRKRFSWVVWLQAFLFITTIWSASLVGASFHWSFVRNQPAIVLDRDVAIVERALFDPEMLLTGLWYSVPLLVILTAHEFGHYFACVFYRIRATLPYYLPAPTLIGTLGAFIRIRGIIYSRSQLFDVGVAGPIAGFVFLLPLLLVGVSLSKVIPGIGTQGDLVFGAPPLLRLVEMVLFPGVPESDILLHPVARAALIGMLATALNLLPVGQLDGGHIVYCLFPRRHLWLSRFFVVLVLLPLGFVWEGWWFWAAVLFIFRLRHPAVYDNAQLGPGRKLVAFTALVIFLLCFTISPVV